MPVTFIIQNSADAEEIANKVNSATRWTQWRQELGKFVFTINSIDISEVERNLKHVNLKLKEFRSTTTKFADTTMHRVYEIKHGLTITIPPAESPERPEPRPESPDSPVY